MGNKTLREVARKIEPYIVEKVDTKTGLHELKFPLPIPLYLELKLQAMRNHVSLREFLTRAAKIYLALDIENQKPGTYYTRHTPGEPDERIIFPF